jgi:hypothetical protein
MFFKNRLRLLTRRFDHLPRRPAGNVVLKNQTLTNELHFNSNEKFSYCFNQN